MRKILLVILMFFLLIPCVNAEPYLVMRQTTTLTITGGEFDIGGTIVAGNISPLGIMYIDCENYENLFPNGDVVVKGRLRSGFWWSRWSDPLSLSVSKPVPESVPELLATQPD